MTGDERGPTAVTKRLGYVAAGCGGLLAILAVAMCGLAAAVRRYREFTVPLGLVSGAGMLAMGAIAYLMLARRR